MEITKQERFVLDHYAMRMNQASYGSKEYEAARKIYAWQAENIRKKLKLYEMPGMDNQQA